MATRFLSGSRPKTLTTSSFFSRSRSLSTVTSADSLSAAQSRSSLPPFLRLRLLAGVVASAGRLSPASVRFLATNSTTSSSSDAKSICCDLEPRKGVLTTVFGRCYIHSISTRCYGASDEAFHTIKGSCSDMARRRVVLSPYGLASYLVKKGYIPEKVMADRSAYGIASDLVKKGYRPEEGFEEMMEAATKNKPEPENVLRDEAGRRRYIVDWRRFMGPIHDQEDTNTCWAATAAKVGEVLVYIETGERVFLSNYGVAIDVNGNDKDGRTVLDALTHMSAFGAYMDDDWPWKETEPKSEAKKIYFGGVQCAKGEVLMALMLDKQPFGVAVADHPTLWSYTGGIIREQGFPGIICAKENCQFYEKEIDRLCLECGYGFGWHSMTCVATGEAEEGISFWELENSWGSDVGECGRVLIERGRNVMGIEHTEVCAPMADSEWELTATRIMPDGSKWKDMPTVERSEFEAILKRRMWKPKPR